MEAQLGEGRIRPTRFELVFGGLFDGEEAPYTGPLGEGDTLLLQSLGTVVWVPDALKGARRLVVSVYGGDIRYTWGPDPTASLGHLMGDRDRLVLQAPAAIRSFRLINTSAGTRYVVMTAEY